MIITVTGKPCSGKGTVCKLISNKYNFEYISTGDMFRELAAQNSQDILNFQKNDNIKTIDNMIDSKIVNIGKTRLEENIIIDSRLAWHFIPESFKVFIDVSLDVASERLLNATRDIESAKTQNEAMELLCDRWTLENDRYLDLYGVTNLDPSQYDLVVCSDDMSPEEVSNEIYSKYLDFTKNKHSN